MTEFAFVLALALGKSLPEVLSMPALEVRCWAARYAEEPFGEYRADLRSGLVAAQVANTFLPRNATPATARDFMPFAKPRKPMTDDELEARCRARAGAA